MFTMEFIAQIIQREVFRIILLVRLLLLKNITDPSGLAPEKEKGGKMIF